MCTVIHHKRSKQSYQQYKNVPYSYNFNLKDFYIIYIVL